jgi:hypothetical protein
MKNFLFIAAVLSMVVLSSCAEETAVNDQITDSVTQTTADTTAVADTAAVDTTTSVVIP